MNIVGVRFRQCGGGYNSGQYHYYTAIPLNVGDHVVVEVSSNLTIAQVSATDVCTQSATKWIVDKIDTTVYDNQQAKLKRIASLKKELDKRSKKLGDVALFAILAKEDDEMARMLHEYQLLTK